MLSDSEKEAPWGDSFQGRFWWWRNKVEGLTLEEVREEVNEHLPDERRVAVSTLSNYEARGRTESESRRASEPRASFLAALGEAFPDLSVEWLVTGEGSPAKGRKPGEDARRDVDALLRQEASPFYRRGGPRVTGLFLEALNRVERSLPREPGKLAETSPEKLAKLGGLISNLVHAPSNALDPRPARGQRHYVDYATAGLHLVMLAIPPRGEGYSLEHLIGEEADNGS